MICFATKPPVSKYRHEVEPEAEAFAARDPEAMGILFERYREHFVSIAQRHLKISRDYRRPVQRTEAEDIVQECYFQIWKNRQGKAHYSGPGPVFVWLRACIRYTFSNHEHHENRRKRRGNRCATSLDHLKEDGHREPAGGADPVSIAEKREDCERIQKELAEMSESTRTAVQLRLDGRRFSEIGKGLGISRQAAHQHYQKGVTALTEMLCSQSQAPSN